jgi:hypothetical protein
VNAQAPPNLRPDEARIVAQGADEVGGYRSDRVIVRFRPGLCDGAAAAHGVEVQRTWAVDPPGQLSREFRAEWRRRGVLRMQPLYPFAFGNTQAAAALGLDRIYVMELPAGSDAPDLVSTLRGMNADCESAEMDTIGSVAEFIPNDPEFWRQYSLQNIGGTSAVADADIDATDAWGLSTGTGGADVIVAVIDSGVNPHPEFASRMLTGINLANPSFPTTNTSDECAPGHGTHVTGILTATGNNGAGIAGVTWGAKILPVRVMRDGQFACTGNLSAATAAVIWATDNGADIINMSVQYQYTGTVAPDIPAFEAAVDYAVLNGVLVVAATGNANSCGVGNVCAPARFANAMAVSGTTDDDRFASGSPISNFWLSNYGPEVDVCAPGDRIYSSTGMTTYGTLNGTSMATPHVSGLAALIRSFVPEITVSELRSVIIETAEDLTWNPFGEPPLPGWDQYYGHGRINAYRALLAAGAFRIVGSDPPDGAIDARQPSDPEGLNPAGWDRIELLFGGDRGAFGTVASTEFEVLEEGATAAGALQIISITPDEAESTVTVLFDRPITAGGWVTLRHLPSDTEIRVGFLPGDVNGDGTSAPADILAVIDAINEVTVLPAWSTDVDRSGETGPSDILRVIDLLNGAAEYDPWLHVSLP